MRVRLITGWLLLFLLVAAIGYAQQPPTTPTAPAAPAPRLSLAEALDIARRNNPTYLSSANNRWGASRSAMSASAQLFTPSMDINTSAYTAGEGSQTLGGVTFPVPPTTRTGWGLTFGYQLSARTFANRGLQSSNLRAVDEEITSSSITLETEVRERYLLLLRTAALEDLARRTLERRAEEQELARARHQVGQVTLIDVRQAEVARGQAEVGLLRAQQDTENQTLLLFETLGVPAPARRIQPTDSFPVVEPRWSREDLVTRALAENPSLRSLRARESQARWNVRFNSADYLPTLSLQAGYGKFNSRQTITVYDTATGNPIGTMRQTSSGINPWNLQVFLSLPIYDQFSRNATRATARAQEEDARLMVRSRELSVRTQVNAAFNVLELAYRTIAIQDANRTASSEALELATQRYRVGSGTYIDLLTARVVAEEAAGSYIAAVYDYHRAIAALENAVGRPLR